MTSKAKDTTFEAKAKDVMSFLEAPEVQGHGLEDWISDSVISCTAYDEVCNVNSKYFEGFFAIGL